MDLPRSTREPYGESQMTQRLDLDLPKDTATDVAERSLDETMHLEMQRFIKLGSNDTATDVAEKSR